MPLDCNRRATRVADSGVKAHAWRARYKAAIALLLYLAGWVAQAQTLVGGDIDVNTRWSLSQSPFVVQRDIAVLGGAALTIDPGVFGNAGAGIQGGVARLVGVPPLLQLGERPAVPS